MQSRIIKYLALSHPWSPILEDKIFLFIHRVTPITQRGRRSLAFDRFNINQKNRWLLTKKWSAGRDRTGTKTILSKGSRIKRRITTVAMHLTLTKYMFFINDIHFNAHTRSFYADIATMSGLRLCIPATTDFRLWHLVPSYDMQVLIKILRSKQNEYSPYIERLLYIKIHTDICNIYDVLQKRIVFIKAAGTKGHIIKKEERFESVVIRMPSGYRKEIHISNFAMFGYNLTPLKRFEACRLAGYTKKQGFKPKVRGVAKNPVDHPHGGREKTICNPVSPWGWYTKAK